MSGALHAPLLAPQRAAKLIEEVVFERVVACIDLERLFEVESDLWAMLEESGAAEHEAPKLAKDLVDRALRRLCVHPRRYEVCAIFSCNNVAAIDDDIARETRRNQAGYSLRPPARFPFDVAESEAGHENGGVS